MVVLRVALKSDMIILVSKCYRCSIFISEQQFPPLGYLYFFNTYPVFDNRNISALLLVQRWEWHYLPKFAASKIERNVCLSHQKIYPVPGRTATQARTSRCVRYHTMLPVPTLGHIIFTLKNVHVLAQKHGKILFLRFGKNKKQQYKRQTFFQNFTELLA